MKQVKITDLLQTEREEAAQEGKEQFYEFTNFSVSKKMPTVENVRKRLGYTSVGPYRALLERAEDNGIIYEIDEGEKMNKNCVQARLRMMEDACENAENTYCWGV